MTDEQIKVLCDSISKLANIVEEQSWQIYALCRILTPEQLNEYIIHFNSIKSRKKDTTNGSN